MSRDLCRIDKLLAIWSPLSPLHFSLLVQASWNVMAHAQKPDFVFRRNGRFHINRRGASVQSTTGSRGVRISGSNAGYTMFRGSVKGTGYPLHSPVYPLLPFLRHRVPSHFNWILMLNTPCCEVVWRVLTTHSIRQFSLYFPSRASPRAITFQLEYTIEEPRIRVNS